MSQPPILVIGSTGKTGSRVAARLEAQGLSVRHASRQSTTPFDWQDRSTWAPVLEGVESAYVTYYPDLLAPEAPGDIRAFTEAAKAAGVKHVVLLSGRGEDGAVVCENIVRESGLSFTLLRASWFQQNFTEGMLLGPVLDGVIAMPAGDVKEPFVDADDIADAAVAALIDDRHAGQLYELTGPRLMTFTEAAAEISEARGVPVAYVPITLDEFHAGLAELAGADAATMWTELCREVLDGRNESLTPGVQDILGREPRDFAPFARQAAAAGAWAL